MAENKNKVIVYADWIHKFEELEDDEAGRLIKHFFRYINDLNPDPPDRTTKLMFIDIKNTLKRDLDKWEEKSPERIEKARIAGIASAEARKIKKELNSTNELKNQLNPTKSTVSVSVSDTVNVSVSEKEKLKILNSFLLSEIKISNDNNFLNFGEHVISISEKERINFKTAVWFQKLFIKNLKEKNSPTSTQEKAKYKSYVDPIRLMFDVDKVTQEQIKTAYEFLNSIDGEFWKKNILSTETLRKQIQKLIIQKNSSNGKSEQQFTGNTKTRARFSIARAEQTLLADAERKRTEMENRNG